VNFVLLWPHEKQKKINHGCILAVINSGPQNSSIYKLKATEVF